MLYRIDPNTLGRRPASAAALLGGLARRFGDWRRNRAAVDRLSGVGDRLLADMGVERSEIARRVRSGAAPRRRG